MQAYNKNYSYRRTAHIRPSKSKLAGFTLKGVLVVICLILLALIAKNLLASKNDDEPVAKQAGVFSQKEEKPPEPPKKIVNTSGLAAAIDQINAQYSYNVSVAVIELNSDKLIQTGDTYAYVAASTTKLLTALYYFNKVEKGQESLAANIGGRPAKEQMRLMINRSDNVAWHSLNDYLVKSNLQVFAHKQGLQSFNAEANTMTSNDMAQLMAKIYKRELANNEHTDLLLSWMQNTSEERFIPPAVPVTSKLYHKAGYLPDRAHDVAIIDNGSTPFVLVVYSKSYTNSYDYLTGQKIFKQITTQAVNTFSQ